MAAARVHDNGTWMAQLAAGGVEVVNISPIREDGPAATKPEWIAIKPGTDTALLLALTHTLIANDLHDRDFLARYTTGFDKVRAYVMGESDGRPKDADWAALITGIPADTIRALARRMAANRTMLSASWSLQRADHGEQPFWGVILLASCLGQIGLPGGGFGFGYGSATGIAEPPLAFHAPTMEAVANPLNNRAIPAARISECLLRPGEPYDFNGRRQRLSRYQARLLGGRQSVSSSSGHQQAARRVPAPADHRGSRTVVDGDSAPRRHRAAGDDHAGAQRFRWRAA